MLLLANREEKPKAFKHQESYCYKKIIIIKKFEMTADMCIFILYLAGRLRRIVCVLDKAIHRNQCGRMGIVV